MHRAAIALATFFGVGRIPFAPGTFGSLPGLVLTFAARATGAWWLEAAILVALYGAGIWAATVAERHFGGIDPGPVVIDEVVGMMITIAFVPVGWVGAGVAFVVFRACDVVKPFPARRLERLPGGLGVMSDDVMAGLWGLAAVHLLVWAFPQWMLP